MPTWDVVKNKGYTLNSGRSMGDVIAKSERIDLTDW